MYQAAAAMANSLSSSFAREKVSFELAKFILKVSDGDCAFLREWTREKVYTLVGDAVSASGVIMAGKPPREKHTDDGPCDPTKVDGGDRDPKYGPTAKARRQPNDGDKPFYDPQELAFMEQIGSEGWIPIYYQNEPVALLVVMKRDPGHFSEARLEELRRYQAFVQAFYHLAAAADDQIEKVLVLKRVAPVLAELAEAPSLAGFRRAVCTLLTCQYGFRFDRALLFWLPNKGYPAVCEMAVGGRDKTWADERLGIEKLFGNLREYIIDSLQFPDPGTSKDKAGPRDPLFDDLKMQKLLFEDTDGGLVRTVIERKAEQGGGAIRLTSKDEWIKRVQQERPGIFTSPHDEYFLFPLEAVDGQQDAPLFGFIIADMAYQPRKHMPRPGNPDLGVIALVVKLLAGLWHSRNSAESYLNLLAALPELRHSAPILDLPVALLDHEMRKPREKWDETLIREEVTTLVPIATKLANAGRLLERTRITKFTQSVPNLGDFLRDFLPEMKQRYGEKLDCQSSLTYAGGVKIVPHFLRSMLACIVDNAVDCCGVGKLPVHVEVRSNLVKVPEGKGRTGERVMIEVSNDGPAIDAKLIPFLFVNKVTTHALGERHRGSGLSSARLLAQSHGGDIILLQGTKPVTFAIVLRPMPE